MRKASAFVDSAVILVATKTENALKNGDQDLKDREPSVIDAAKR
jgi:hypothetical protein